MPYSIESNEGCKRTLNFEYENVNLEEQISKALEEKRKTATMKGFRPGKAPMNLIKQMYGAQAENEAVYGFIQKELMEAIQKEELRTVGYPTFNETNYEADKKNLKFSVSIEVFPEFELKDLSGYSFTKDSTEVKDEDYEALKKNYLNSKSEMIAIEDEGAALEVGQFAVMNFEGEKEDGERPDNMKGEEYLLEIGSNTFIPGFEDEMKGMKAKDKKSFQVTFPETYHEESLQNAPVTFHVELLEIKTKKLPELDDDIAKEFGFEGALDFAKKLRENLEKQKDQQAKEKLNQEILEKLIADNEFDVPHAMIHQQEHAIQEDMKRNLQQQGFTDEMCEEYFQKWQGDLQQRAEFQVKSGLILNSLADKFQVTASESDLAPKFEEMASQSGMGIDEIKKYYTGNDNLMQNLMYMVKEEKTFEKIYSEVKIS